MIHVCGQPWVGGGAASGSGGGEDVLWRRVVAMEGEGRCKVNPDAGEELCIAKMKGSCGGML